MASFFENQQLARRNTRILVVLYVLAVVGVIIAVDVVLAAVYLYSFADRYPPRGGSPGIAELMRLVGAVLDCPLPPLLETVDPTTLAA